MATSAFKSTTKRTPIGASSSSTDDSVSSDRSSSHRRSRSLSRFSRRLPETAADDFEYHVPPPRGKFVNTVRGSGFPEISLDDLAIEFFGSGDRGRSGSRSSEAVPLSDSGTSSSQRRGRSVSRQSSKMGGDGRGSLCNSSSGGRVVPESNSRRRRSVSVVRCQISDSDNSRNRANLKSFGNANNKMPLPHRPAVSNQRQVLRRSFSQKDLQSHDGYSSQSSVLTDDEGKDAHSNRSGIEKTTRTFSAQNKVERLASDDINGEFYAAMREELINAVEGIRMELEQAAVKTKESFSGSDDCLQPNNSNVLRAVSSIRKNYSTVLEQSEKRKKDLLAKMVLEEHRDRELSKIVNKLLPDPKKTAVEKPSQARKRSSDRSRMSKCLTEEAEKYIEDFISNVEDTDISSLDGERSDTSSSLGGMVKPETLQSPAASNPLPVEMDGVVLPWLSWEASNDATPQSCKSKAEPPVTPISLWDATQEVSSAQNQSNRSASSRGSWSPIAGTSMYLGEDAWSKSGGPGSYGSQSCSNESKGLCFDMDDYLKVQSNEDFLFERLNQTQRINSGGLLLCNRTFSWI
ncbi:uncharacterized protein LOC121236471 isoform X2 [Juglans microcarpa x Juglans regia]|uniref:uncharacterized protein LOC121236471 isoform X2 n=1 Tax=Juglans microcarpa x Juglans regia TaxID=2249226 RepID=UPI001B7E16DE|nr:uncharacterized protein LOC121236471 isoform X2 [Juglans microcarpa x Juglans regia]